PWSPTRRATSRPRGADAGSAPAAGFYASPAPRPFGCGAFFCRAPIFRREGQILHMHYKTGISYVIYIGYCAEASAPTDIFQTDCERRGVHETGRMAVPADPAGDPGGVLAELPAEKPAVPAGYLHHDFR